MTEASIRPVWLSFSHFIPSKAQPVAYAVVKEHEGVVYGGMGSLGHEVQHPGPYVWPQSSKKSKQAQSQDVAVGDGGGVVFEHPGSEKVGVGRPGQAG